MSCEPQSRCRSALRAQSGGISCGAGGAEPIVIQQHWPTVHDMPSDKLEHRPEYTIDALDRLIDYNGAFVSTLPAAFHDDAVLDGRSIWDLISGTVSRQLWKVLYSRVRGMGTPMFVPMRRDTPNHRRLVDLELHPVGDRCVRHVQECVWSEARTAVVLLDPNFPRDDRKLNRCGWCARIQVALGTWLEVEEAYVRLGLEASASLPVVKDGACTPCKQSILRSFPARVA